MSTEKDFPVGSLVEVIQREDPEDDPPIGTQFKVVAPPRYKFSSDEYVFIDYKCKSVVGNSYLAEKWPMSKDCLKLVDGQEYFDYIPLANKFECKPPEDDPNGRWPCSVDDKDFFNFIEVHPSRAWRFDRDEAKNRRVILRVSQFRFDSIHLSDCVILDKEKLKQLHAHIGRMLEDM